MPAIETSRYIPRHERKWDCSVTDGSITAEIYTEYGIVSFFTCPGGYSGSHYHSAFTKLEIYIHPHVYIRRIDRNCHPRWVTRVANQFAFDCYLESQR